MPDKKEDTKTTIVESAARGGMSAVMPYVTIVGVGVIGYLLIKDDIKEGFGNVATNASRVVENISETINKTTKNITERITETINNTTENISNFVDDHTLNAEERKDIELEAAAFSVGSAPGVKLPNLSTEQQNFISKYAVNTGVDSFRESPFLDIGLGQSTSPLDRSMLGLELFSGNTTKTENNNNNNNNNNKNATGKSSKTPTGPTLTLTDSEVAALKSLGKKPVTGPNTTGEPRVLSRPDKFGNRYDVTDLSTSRRF